jgi:hypothetical protein
MHRLGVALAAIGSSLLLCSPASAQQAPAGAPAGASSVPEEARDKLANDLANLQLQVEHAQRELQTANSSFPGIKKVEVTREAKVFAGADPSAPTEFTVGKGTDLSVLDKSNNFYAVADTAQGKTGWVMTSDVKPTWGDYTGYYTTTGTPVSSMQSAGNTTGNQGWMNSIRAAVYKQLTDSAVAFRDSYKDNPYFRVTGFTVVVSLPPALNLEFAFK